MEQAIGRMKNWKKLQELVPVKTLEWKDKEIRVVCHLCKFLPQLVADDQSGGMGVESKVNSVDGNMMHPMTLDSLLQNEHNEEFLN